MFRRAQLAMCDAAFHQAARDVLPPPPLAEAPGDRHVEDDGQQDQRAEDRVTPELADLSTRARLWSKVPMSTAPRNAPMIVPLPPSVLTPPTTAAAIAASSRPEPAVTLIVPKRPT